MPLYGSTLRVWWQSWGLDSYGYSKLDSKIDNLGDKLGARLSDLGERVARIEGILSVSESRKDAE